MANKKEVKEVVKADNMGFEVLCRRFGKERVEEWQKQYAPRKLNVIEVEGKLAVLRPIGVAEIGNYSMMLANVELGIAKANEYLLNELWIDGDTEILENEEYLIAAILQVQNSLELKKSTFYTV